MSKGEIAYSTKGLLFPQHRDFDYIHSAKNEIAFCVVGHESHQKMTP